MRRWLVVFSIGILCFASCKQKPAVISPQASREDTVLQNLQQLKKEAVPGDLVVRLGDDLLSYQIKLMNEKEQLYSHAGIVMEKGGEKVIAHITPDNPETDGIQFTAIDSFLNPAKNLSCALYHYSLTPVERAAFTAVIDRHKTAQLRFDRLYELETDDAMYCSEMISKAIEEATVGRIECRRTDIPPRMLPALYRYFKKEASEKEIAQRKIMTIDNLYRIPECRLVMQFPLKFLPGQ